MGLNENMNQADKVYFNTGLLSEPVRDNMLYITGGDNFTKLVCDLYYHFNKYAGGGSDPSVLNKSNMKMADTFYRMLKVYDKKLFPIPGNLTDYSAEGDNDHHVLTLFEMLKERNNLVRYWSEIPSLVKRNFKPLIDQFIYGDNAPAQYFSYRFKEAATDVKDIADLVKTLPEKKANEVIPKLFSSIKTLPDIKKGIQNLRNTMSMINPDSEIDSNLIVDLANDYKCPVLINQNNLVVVKVTTPEAMQRLGCYSSWCFSIPGGEGYWDEYAGSGYVFVIYNLNMNVDDSRFLMVYLPDTGELYLSNNVPFSEVYPGSNANQYLLSIGVDVNKLTARTKQKKPQRMANA